MLRTDISRLLSERCRDSGAVIGFTTTYKYAGTAKVCVSRTIQHIVWIGMWVVAEEKILSCLCAGKRSAILPVLNGHDANGCVAGRMPKPRIAALSNITKIPESLKNILEKIPEITSSKL